MYDEDFITDRRLGSRGCQDRTGDSRTVFYANQDRLSSRKEWKWKSVGKAGERMCAGRTVRWPVSRGRGQVNAHRLAPPPHTMEPGDHRTVSSLSSASPLPPPPHLLPTHLLSRGPAAYLNSALRSPQFSNLNNAHLPTRYFIRFISVERVMLYSSRICTIYGIAELSLKEPIYEG